MDRKPQGGRIGGSHFEGPPHWGLAALAGAGVGTLLLFLLSPPAPQPVINIQQPAPAAPVAPPVIHNTTKVRVEINDLELARYGPPVISIDGETQFEPSDRFRTGRQKRSLDAEAFIRCHEFGFCSD